MPLISKLIDELFLNWDTISSNPFTHFLAAVLGIFLGCLITRTYYLGSHKSIKENNDSLNERIKTRDEKISNLEETIQLLQSSLNTKSDELLAEETKVLPDKLYKIRKREALKNETITLIREVQEFLKKFKGKYQAMENKLGENDLFMVAHYKKIIRSEFENKFRSRYEVQKITILSVLNRINNITAAEDFFIKTSKIEALSAMMVDLEIIARELDFLEDY